MIPPQIAVINWEAIGVITAVALGVLSVIGWFVQDRMSIRRDIRNAELRRIETKSMAAASACREFHSSLRPLLDKISKTTVPLSTYKQSIHLVEQAVYRLIPHLDSETSVRLEAEWQKYQAIQKYQFQGESIKGQSGVRTDYTAARNVLAVPLKEMLAIATIKPSNKTR